MNSHQSHLLLGTESQPPATPHNPDPQVETKEHDPDSSRDKLEHAAVLSAQVADDRDAEQMIVLPLVPRYARPPLLEDREAVVLVGSAPRGRCGGRCMLAEAHGPSRLEFEWLLMST